MLIQRVAHQLTHQGDEAKQRVLIFAAHFWPAVAAGGTARSVSNIVAEIGTTHDVTVVTSAADLDSKEGFEDLSGRWINYFGARVYYVDAKSNRQWLSIFRLLHGKEWDIVLLNSMWNVHFSLVPAVLRGLGYLRVARGIMMPRGEMTPGALKVKRLKKILGKPAVRALYATTMDFIGVTSESEFQQATAWFPRTPSIRVRETPDFVPFGEQPPSGPLRILFLGRIHPTKGLLDLLRGLLEFDEVADLAVAGPIADDAYWQECLKVEAQVPSRVRITHLGNLGRTEIVQRLHETDVLATLTLGENFGHTIAEALQAGCLVLTTSTTPWTGLLRQGAGLVIKNREDSAEVAGALRALARRPPAERRTSRLNARNAFDIWLEKQPDDFVSSVRQAEIDPIR